MADPDGTGRIKMSELRELECFQLPDDEADEEMSAQRLYAIVPAGAKGGDVLALEDESGGEHLVVLPANLVPGDKFCYVVPPKQPARARMDKHASSTASAVSIAAASAAAAAASFFSNLGLSGVGPSPTSSAGPRCSSAFGSPMKAAFFGNRERFTSAVPSTSSHEAVSADCDDGRQGNGSAGGLNGGGGASDAEPPRPFLSPKPSAAASAAAWEAATAAAVMSREASEPEVLSRAGTGKASIAEAIAEAEAVAADEPAPADERLPVPSPSEAVAAEGGGGLMSRMSSILGSGSRSASAGLA